MSEVSFSNSLLCQMVIASICLLSDSSLLFDEESKLGNST